MKTYNNLYSSIVSIDNLKLAYEKARKHKTKNKEVLKFEEKLRDNLQLLHTELLLQTYRPKPLTTFIIRDPKTRKISKSAFRDRVVHHALCNVIEPIFDKIFIYDSYANRIGKGTLKAIERFDYFKRKVSHNFTRKAYVLKADIRHYFEEVDQSILLSLLKRKVFDQRVLWLARTILSNYGKNGKSMPLGNLTSQFFANIYLHELDKFVKQELKAGYYLRYVDDFLILHTNKNILKEFKAKINQFIENKLALTLHPSKSKIIPISRGVGFLGLKIFLYHKLIKRKNMLRFKQKLSEFFQMHEQKEITYDCIYNFLEGWMAYAKHANTHNLRRSILVKFEERFPQEISSKEVNRGLPKKGTI